ncbi:MAG: helix-turn-helix transcriptional regulator [Alphaproteobacteria bacterium]|nr:MAG: helix-turn-helix transcriptional regulator [Alphaproteobacteria bacterium]
MAEIKDQPPPVPNTREASWDLVLQDIKDRDKIGQERYGTRLQPLNGRDTLVDLYQELLDAVVYARTLIAEGWRERAMAAEQKLAARSYVGPVAFSSDGLRQQRIAAKMSQGALADHLEVSRNTVIAWESGKSEPSASKLAMAATLFVCHIADFFEPLKNAP